MGLFLIIVSSDTETGNPAFKEQDISSRFFKFSTLQHQIKEPTKFLLFLEIKNPNSKDLKTEIQERPTKQNFRKCEIQPYNIKPKQNPRIPPLCRSRTLFLALIQEKPKGQRTQKLKSKQDPQNFIFKKKVRKYKKLVIDKWKERFRFFLLEALYGDEEDRKGFLGIYKGKEQDNG